MDFCKQMAVMLLLIISSFHAYAIDTLRTVYNEYHNLPGQWSSIGHAACLSKSGNYVVTGANERYPRNGYQSIFAMEVDTLGISQWFSQVHDSTYERMDHDGGRAVISLRDGGYLVTGSSGRKVSLMKVSENGELLFHRRYNFSSSFAFDVVETKDNGFAIVGKEQFADSLSAFVFKTDSNGDSLWMCRLIRQPKVEYGTYTFAGLSSVVESSNGDLFVCGDIWLAKIGIEGEIVYSKDFFEPWAGSARSIQVSEEGIVTVLGSLNTDTTSAVICRVDSNGELLKSCHCVADTLIEYITSCTALPGIGYAFAGTYKYNWARVVVVDTSGAVIKQWSVERGGSNYPNSIVYDGDSHLFGAGYANGTLWLYCLSLLDSSSASVKSINKTISAKRMYNPLMQMVRYQHVALMPTIRIGRTAYDLHGRMVQINLNNNNLRPFLR